MRIWFDTEFIEDGKTIDLLSIGMINEAGDRLYIENADCDRARASDWVKENVLPHLSGPLMPREQIAKSIKSFAGGSPEFWGYYADYDWVVLCQLYGTMMDLPDGWPMYCRDLKQLMDAVGDTKSPLQNETEHNALSDAIWMKETHQFFELKAHQ
ncbi:MAG: 3'-5' exoribonuclease domain-containing protein [Pikeienuella sp.]